MALKLKEPVVANDVAQHPWYINIDGEDNIKSILVCPLFDPISETDYGTISICCNEIDAFSPDDEMAILSLANQTSLVITKFREFEEWKRQGGICAGLSTKSGILTSVRRMMFYVSRLPS